MAVELKSPLARDPRKEPRAGDVLRKAGEWIGLSDFRRERVVMQTAADSVWHNRGACTLATWRKWAAGAEVIHVAD